MDMEYKVVVLLADGSNLLLHLAMGRDGLYDSVEDAEKDIERYKRFRGGIESSEDYQKYRRESDPTRAVKYTVYGRPKTNWSMIESLL